MLYEVLGDIWVVQRNLPEDDLLDNPKRRRLLVDALHHRLPKSKNAARPRRRRDAMVGRTAGGRPRRRASVLTSPLTRSVCALQARRRAALTAGTTSFDGLARVSHVTDATDWRVEYPSSCSRPTPSRDGGLVAGLHRAGPDHRPARRRHRLHRRRGAADLEERGHQHREARADDRGADGPPAGRGPPWCRRSGARPAW